VVTVTAAAHNDDSMGTPHPGILPILGMPAAAVDRCGADEMQI